MLNCSRPLSVLVGLSLLVGCASAQPDEDPVGQEAAALTSPPTLTAVDDNVFRLTADGVSGFFFARDAAEVSTWTTEQAWHDHFLTCEAPTGVSTAATSSSATGGPIAQATLHTNVAILIPPIAAGLFMGGVVIGMLCIPSSQPPPACSEECSQRATSGAFGPRGFGSCGYALCMSGCAGHRDPIWHGQVCLRCASGTRSCP